ncbi:hypothetical protein Bbelb_350770 [Branchiostoma belcheri]|nr:hypothetical protein Bbelb_350770 [Branchiostoma belcheri]
MRSSFLGVMTRRGRPTGDAIPKIKQIRRRDTEKELSELGMRWKDVEREAKNRARWREIVGGLCSARGQGPNDPRCLVEASRGDSVLTATVNNPPPSNTNKRARPCSVPLPVLWQSGAQWGR